MSTLQEDFNLEPSREYSVPSVSYEPEELDSLCSEIYELGHGAGLGTLEKEYTCTRFEQIKELIKTEIRKAEERKDKHYKEEIEKIIKEYKGNHHLLEIIESLEALKK